MTGRINFTPETRQQLHHLDAILVFPLAGRARDDVRPGMRTITFKKRTVVAYEVDESSGELMVNVLGVFHGGQDWEAALGEIEGDPEAGRWAGAERG